MTPGDLSRFSQALLILNECQSAKDLERTLLASMQVLCDADFHTVNSIGTHAFGIFSSTVNYSDAEMATFNAHLAEHPSLWVVEAARREDRPIGARWSDRTSLREFRLTALHRDFFRLLGINHQAAAVVKVNDSLTLGFASNRTSMDFRLEDIQLLEMLLVHVRQLVWRLIGQMEVQNALAIRELAIGEEAVLVADLEGRLLYASARAKQLARDFFQPHRPDALPFELQHWLQSHPLGATSFVQEVPGRRLTCHCGPVASWSSGTMPEALQDLVPSGSGRCVRLAEHSALAIPRTAQRFSLTPREAQVLHWMAEGKRNGEIATILGISERTVDKHREHIFAKLNVETRTSAVARARE